ncbi:MAG TPA: hypothetical protein VNB06_02660 [Thermoanaerobaculia bacterium]|nr:hypothetical protein [Thermoanaerobaculia bacterium]
MHDPAAQTPALRHTGEGWSAIALAVLAALATGVATGWLALHDGGGGSSEGLFQAALVSVILALLAPAAVRSGFGAAPVAWCVVLACAAVAQASLTDVPLRAATLGLLLALAVAATWLGLGLGRIDLGALLPLCIATQVLARAPTLVEREPGALAAAMALFELVGLPAIAALAAVALPRFSRDRDIEAATVMLALLAAVVAAGRFHASLVATLLAFALTPRVFGADTRLALRLLWAVPLVAVVVLRPAVGIVAVAGALALTLRRGWPAVLLVSSALLLWLLPARSWSDAALGPILLVVLLPAAVAAIPPMRGVLAEDSSRLDEPERGALFPLAAAALLALVALRALDPRAGLVAPVLLLVLLTPLSTAARQPGGGLQRWLQGAWLALLLAFGLAAQALPWMRMPGASDLLALLGWRSLAATALLAAGAVTLFVIERFAASRGTRGVARASRLLVPPALGFCLLLPAASQAPHGGIVLLDWPPRVLTESAPRFAATFDASSLPNRLVIDSALAHTGTLPAGTHIARVSLLSERDGEVLLEAPFLLGTDSGEWSAGSPHLRGAPAPPAHLVAIAEGGAFFAKRYRAEVVFDASGHAAEADRRLELRIEREPSLPAPVTLTVFGIRALGTTEASDEAGAP